MSKAEILVTPYGEMMDMLTCLSIFNGTAKPRKKWTFDDILMLE